MVARVLENEWDGYIEVVGKRGGQTREGSRQYLHVLYGGGMYCMYDWGKWNGNKYDTGNGTKLVMDEPRIRARFQQ